MQNKVTKEEFDAKTAFEQGIAVYHQGDTNDEIPNENPYRKGTADYDQFEAGIQDAHKRAETELN